MRRPPTKPDAAFRHEIPGMAAAMIATLARNALSAAAAFGIVATVLLTSPSLALAAQLVCPDERALKGHILQGDIS